MNEEEARKIFQQGSEETKQIVEQMVHLMMDCYQNGFNTCWKLFTGKDFEK